MNSHGPLFHKINLMKLPKSTNNLDIMEAENLF